MLGNFSLGDYFKQGAVEFAWELSREGFGFDAETIWVTVFEGDDALGLGPDEEAIAAWEAIGVPRERIVLCPRIGELLAGRPDRPVRAVQRAVPRPRPGVRPAPTTCPAARTSASWSSGTSSSCSTTRTRSARSRRCPTQNIDTGMGLNRMACILQGVETVFETDQFAPLIAARRGAVAASATATTTRPTGAAHPRRPHARDDLPARDGVVPSNEDRGYVLRRIMRRAIARAHLLGVSELILPRYQEVVTDMMGGAYPELVERATRSRCGPPRRRSRSGARSSTA